MKSNPSQQNLEHLKLSEEEIIGEIHSLKKDLHHLESNYQKVVINIQEFETSRGIENIDVDDLDKLPEETIRSLDELLNLRSKIIKELRVIKLEITSLSSALEKIHVKENLDASKIAAKYNTVLRRASSKLSRKIRMQYNSDTEKSKQIGRDLYKFDTEED